MRASETHARLIDVSRPTQHIKAQGVDASFAPSTFISCPSISLSFAMSCEVAVTELDGTLEWMASCISRDIAAAIERGVYIPPDEVSHRLLDYPLGLAADMMSELLMELAENGESDDEEVEEARVNGELASANAFEDLDMALWELFHKALSQPALFSRDALARQIAEAIAEQRPALVELLERPPSATQSSPSSPMADERGVVLPTARHR